MTQRFNIYTNPEHFKELDKLEEYLKEHEIPYEREDVDGDPSESPVLLDFHQITVFDEKGAKLWDVICHYGSYGYDEGLLEIMGSISKKQDVEGNLTAATIINRIEGKKEKWSDDSLRPCLNLEDFKDAISTNACTKTIRI